MLQITEVNIFSLSKDEDAWTIEGEIIFEDDLTSAFEADYLPDEDELGRSRYSDGECRSDNDPADLCRVDKRGRHQKYPENTGFVRGRRRRPGCIPQLE